MIEIRWLVDRLCRAEGDVSIALDTRRAISAERTCLVHVLARYESAETKYRGALGGEYPRRDSGDRIVRSKKERDKAEKALKSAAHDAELVARSYGVIL